LVLSPSPAFSHEQGRVLLLARPTNDSVAPTSQGGWFRHSRGDRWGGRRWEGV